MKHILIVGRNGVGKSTLIRALLDEIPLSKYGVITKKEAAYDDGFCPVYIHLYGAEKRYTSENRIGLCREGKSVAFPEVFDRFSDSMRFPSDGVIVFDELGFLETDAGRFTAAVMETLDRAPFVIAAVRDKDTPFLRAVRSHPRSVVYQIDEQNRDVLRENLIRQLSERQES
ncbi:MAG: ATP-binding cassette domain-containing protein [Clostridia bacterium]|nr:ATP-binding cassette domain-containing protein [Clostridia bacterium]